MKRPNDQRRAPRLGAPKAGRRQNLLASYRQEQAVDRLARVWRNALNPPCDEYTGPLQFPFRFRDALKGTWVQARYVAERAVIGLQYREGGITENPEIAHPGGSLCKAGDHAND
jgi:hypothetical protein